MGKQVSVKLFGDPSVSYDTKAHVAKHLRELKAVDVMTGWGEGSNPGPLSSFNGYDVAVIVTNNSDEGSKPGWINKETYNLLFKQLKKPVIMAYKLRNTSNIGFYSTAMHTKPPISNEKYGHFSFRPRLTDDELLEVLNGVKEGSGVGIDEVKTRPIPEKDCFKVDRSYFLEDNRLLLCL